MAGRRSLNKQAPRPPSEGGALSLNWEHNTLTDMVFSGNSATLRGGVLGYVQQAPRAFQTIHARHPHIKQELLLNTVEVVTGGTPTVRPVTVGRRFGGNLEIVSGLTEGEVIRVPKGQVVRTQAPRFGPGAFSASPSATPSRSAR